MQEKTLQLQAGNRADSDTFSTLTADVPFRAALSLACSFQLFQLEFEQRSPGASVQARLRRRCTAKAQNESMLNGRNGQSSSHRCGRPVAQAGTSVPQGFLQSWDVYRT